MGICSCRLAWCTMCTIRTRHADTELGSRATSTTTQCTTCAIWLDRGFCKHTRFKSAITAFQLTWSETCIEMERKEGLIQRDVTSAIDRASQHYGKRREGYVPRIAYQHGQTGRRFWGHFDFQYTRLGTAIICFGNIGYLGCKHEQLFGLIEIPGL